MTLKGIALAAALLAAMTTEAAACHRFSVWRYPWPQRCGVGPHARLTKAFGNQNRKAAFFVNREKAVIELPIEAALPLPLLTRNDCEGGEADELTRGRVLLRAALEAANAH